MRTRPNCDVAACNGRGLVADLPLLLALSCGRLKATFLKRSLPNSTLNSVPTFDPFFPVGFPDKPINVAVHGVVVPGATTVNVNVSWIPGYSGGYPQSFKVKYRAKQLRGPFTTSDASNTPITNVFVVTGLKPETEYEFGVQAQNERGEGEMSNLVLYTTPSKNVSL